MAEYIPPLQRREIKSQPVAAPVTTKYVAPMTKRDEASKKASPSYAAKIDNMIKPKDLSNPDISFNADKTAKKQGVKLPEYKVESKPVTVIEKMNSQNKPDIKQGYNTASKNKVVAKIDQVKQEIVNTGFDLIDRPANAVRVAMQENLKNKDTHGYGDKVDTIGALKEGITGGKRADVKEAFLTPEQIKAQKYSNPVMDFIATTVAGGIIDPVNFATGGTAGSIIKSVLSKVGLSAKLAKGAATIADIAEATGKTEKELKAIIDSERAVQIEKANQTLANSKPIVKTKDTIGENKYNTYAEYIKENIPSVSDEHINNIIDTAHQPGKTDTAKSMNDSINKYQTYAEYIKENIPSISDKHIDDIINVAHKQQGNGTALKTINAIIDDIKKEGIYPESKTKVNDVIPTEVKATGTPDTVIPESDVIIQPSEKVVQNVTQQANKVQTMPMSDRSIAADTPGNVGNRKVNAYQFDNPEVKDNIQSQANYILRHEFASATNDLEPTTQVMRDLKQSTKASYAEIKKGLQQIIDDNGSENTAIAKRVEMVIDDHLTNGYDSIYGESLPPDVDYVAKKKAIEGNVISQQNATQNNIKLGDAIWKNKDSDQPIKITGDYGIGSDGRRYVRVEGSEMGVPLDEIQYSPKESNVNPENVTETVKPIETLEPIPRDYFEYDNKNQRLSRYDIDQLLGNDPYGVGENATAEKNNRTISAIKDITQNENVPIGFKGLEPGDSNYKPINVGMQVQEVNTIAPDKPLHNKTEKFTFENPDIEATHNANQGVKVDGVIQRVKNAVNDMKTMFTRPISTLPVKGNENLYYGRNGLINLVKAKAKAGDSTVRIITEIIQPFIKDKNAYDMFSRKVLLDDLAQEVKLGNSLPNQWTPETVSSELGRLDKAMPQSVKDAVKKRKTVWEEVKKEYSDAMESVGVNIGDRLDREDYFRHQVLDYMNAKKMQGSGKKLELSTNRGFTKGRTGEYTGDINTDYLQAEYEVMAQMKHDSEVARTIKYIELRDDISAKLKVDAKANGVKDWRDIIPEGYALWQPKEGNIFYLYKPVGEEVVDEALKLRGITLDGIKDKKIKVILEDIINDLSNQRDILALGGKRKEFVLKQEIVETLNNMTRTKSADIFARSTKATLTMWKRWVLGLNPRNLFKYNARNMVGDIDALLGADWSAFKKAPQSAKELVDAMRNGKFTKELKSFYDMGGYQGTQYAQEVSQVNALKPFEALKDSSIKDKITKPFRSYADFVGNTSNYREMVLRYSDYLERLDQLKAGKLKGYGASEPTIINALKTNEEKAYKLANDALGAYDSVSEAGQIIRERIIPFYSWVETNFKRYNQLFKNVAKDGSTGDKVKFGALAAAKIGTKATVNIAKIFAATAAMSAWNILRYPELEDTLPNDVRANPHIILGKDKDGNTIYFSRLGSLTDFLDWFGLGNADQDVKDILNGKKTIGEQFKDMAKSPVNKIASGITPFIKTPVELLTGKTFYPDVFNPGNIRDKTQYAAQSLGLRKEYDALMGKPHRPYFNSLQEALLYKANPEESAYYNTIDAKYKYLTKIKGETQNSFYGNKKSNALYNYKLSLKYDDDKAASKYMKLYLKYGGKVKNINASLDTMDPLNGLNKSEKFKFKSSLSQKEKDSLNLAEKYYKEVISK